ncbi:uncharacterized protein LOC118348624 [Juglans regia]|uniref:Uncharacterized protein LOC118348624 n=1 Tax=Juglans regia TaxID=51240 RepID=A0A6P9EE93_JUGRE|nr:uncharacterized protein LOC118348624 [Juglans regia]
MKLYADRKRSERVFQVGDWVFLKLQPYRQKSVAMRHNMKLAPRYYGPFQVIQKIGTVAYKLDLPSSSKIYPVFHVSSLKKKQDDHISPSPTLPPVVVEGSVQPEPELILDKRIKKLGNHASFEVLVKWLGAFLEDSSWESLWKLRSLYPHLLVNYSRSLSEPYREREDGGGERKEKMEEIGFDSRENEQRELGFIV